MHSHIPRIEELVRMGLMSVNKLPHLKRSFSYMETDQFMPHQERSAFYEFVEKLLDMTMKDPMLYRMIRLRTVQHRSISPMRESMKTIDEASTGTKTTSAMSDEMKKKVADDMAKRKAKRESDLAGAKKEMDAYVPDKKTMRSKFMKKESIDEASTGVKSSKPMSDELKAKVADDMAKRKAKLAGSLEGAKKEVDAFVVDKKAAAKKIYQKEDVELQKAPEGMLITFSKIVKSKVRAGGKPTDGDKVLASKAKAELRRRRNVASKRLVPEGNEYSERLQSLLADKNITDIESLTDEQKQEIFSQL